MWQLSNLQIDSSVIQIVQSDVLRNSVDTTAAITNTWASTAFHGYFHGKVHGNLQGNPRQAPTAYHGRPRYNGKTHGMGVAMEYAVAVAVVLPLVAVVDTTEIATDRTAARPMATTVALAVEAPCTMESRGPCRGNPRISTVARGKTHGRSRKCHGHCRGPPPKSKIMCICAGRGLTSTLLARNRGAVSYTHLTLPTKA